MIILVSIESTELEGNQLSVGSCTTNRIIMYLLFSKPLIRTMISYLLHFTSNIHIPVRREDLSLSLLLIIEILHNFPDLCEAEFVPILSGVWNRFSPCIDRLAKLYDNSSHHCHIITTGLVGRCHVCSQSSMNSFHSLNPLIQLHTFAITSRDWVILGGDGDQLGE